MLLSASFAKLPTYKLCRINVLDFASKHGLDEERAIAAFLHATTNGLSSCPGMFFVPPAEVS